MTDRQKKLDAITDDMYYYMIQLTSLASDLEELELERDGDELRGIADDLERLAIRIMDRHLRRKVCAK